MNSLSVIWTYSTFNYKKEKNSFRLGDLIQTVCLDIPTLKYVFNGNKLFNLQKVFHGKYSPEYIPLKNSPQGGKGIRLFGTVNYSTPSLRKLYTCCGG